MPTNPDPHYEAFAHAQTIALEAGWSPPFAYYYATGCASNDGEAVSHAVSICNTHGYPIVDPNTNAHHVYPLPEPHLEDHPTQPTGLPRSSKLSATTDSATLCLNNHHAHIFTTGPDCHPIHLKPDVGPVPNFIQNERQARAEWVRTLVFAHHYPSLGGAGDAWDLACQAYDAYHEYSTT